MNMVNYRFYKNVLLINPPDPTQNLKDVSDLIEEIKPSGHIIIWQPWEAFDERFLDYLEYNYKDNKKHLEKYQYFENTLVKNNIQCYLLVGCDYSEAYSNINTNPIKNFEVIFWPTALLHYTFYGMTSFYKKEPAQLFDPQKVIKKLYLNLNNHDRNHRCMLMDYLCKYGLFDYGINTWNYPDAPWNFEYFTPRKLTFEIDKDEKQTHQVFSSELLNAGNLIDIVSETAPGCTVSRGGENTEYMFHTEKTFRSILFGNPFLVLGNRNQNDNLRKYGIGLYSKIFNYDFDDSDSIKLRCLGIIDNLFGIKDKNYNEIRDHILGVAQANIYTATRIVYYDKYIPSILKSLVGENREEYKILLRDFDANYAESFGLPNNWSLTEKMFKEIYQ